jgi:mobilization protein NikA
LKAPWCQYACIDIPALIADAGEMKMPPKTAQMQIRVTAAEKTAIQRAASRAGMDMSAYVLSKVLSVPAALFRECVADCADAVSPRLALAELNSLLASLTAGELRDAIAAQPPSALSPFVGNYIAAMVECICARRGVAVPGWTRAIAPLPQPVFGSDLQSLRFHLLTHAPPPFRSRNIFIDSTVGDRV